MPLSTDIKLQRKHRPVFPDRCVVCDCESPGGGVWLFTHTVSWWSWWLWVPSFAVKAPACRGCAWRLYAMRLASVLITIGLAFVACWFFWPLVAPYVPRRAMFPVVLVLGAICILPQVLYEVYFPHPISVTAFFKTVQYEFRDEDLAYEFLAVNASALCLDSPELTVDPVLGTFVWDDELECWSIDIELDDEWITLNLADVSDGRLDARMENGKALIADWEAWRPRIQEAQVEALLGLYNDTWRAEDQPRFDAEDLLVCLAITSVTVEDGNWRHLVYCQGGPFSDQQLFGDHDVGVRISPEGEIDVGLEG